MTVRRSALAAYGTLFTALLTFTSSIPAQTPPALSTLYSFTGDLTGPYGGVVIGSGGVLYGTTQWAGTGSCASGCGTVFSLTPPASPGGAWTETVIHNFAGYPTDGACPYAGVVIGSDGVLYGTTSQGGTADQGVVFSLTPPASPGGAWTEAVLYNFSFGRGGQPYAGLVIGNGVLYGAAQYGGPADAGAVFALTPPASPGGAWTEHVLYNFTGGSDGAEPSGGLAIGGRVLYGTTTRGGSANSGTVYSLTPPLEAGGVWTQAVLHSFTGYPSDGANPWQGVAIGPGGVLYGTTVNGGPADPDCGGSNGFCGGTVFSLTPPTAPGGAWNEAVLYSFTGSPNHQAAPYAGVAIGSGGVLYSTTEGGGEPGDYGTAFALTPPTSLGGSWRYVLLHKFCESDGEWPFARLAMGRSGMLYGTTSGGGSSGAGTVFALEP